MAIALPESSWSTSGTQPASVNKQCFEFERVLICGIRSCLSLHGGLHQAEIDQRSRPIELVGSANRTRTVRASAATIRLRLLSIHTISEEVRFMLAGFE